jgi:hypothetical protein
MSLKNQLILNTEEFEDPEKTVNASNSQQIVIGKARKPEVCGIRPGPSSPKPCISVQSPQNLPSNTSYGQRSLTYLP